MSGRPSLAREHRAQGHRFELAEGDYRGWDCELLRCARCGLWSFDRRTQGASFVRSFFSVDDYEPRRWFLISERLPCRAKEWR